MKKYIKASDDSLIIYGKDRSNSPRRYVYELCNYLGYDSLPLFVDSVVGGYRIKYRHDYELPEAQAYLDAWLEAADALGINISRSRLIRHNNYADGVTRYTVFIVIPVYEP